MTERLCRAKWRFIWHHPWLADELRRPGQRLSI